MGNQADTGRDVQGDQSLTMVIVEQTLEGEFAGFVSADNLNIDPVANFRLFSQHTQMRMTACPTLVAMSALPQSEQTKIFLAVSSLTNPPTQDQIASDDSLVIQLNGNAFECLDGGFGSVVFFFGITWDEADGGCKLDDPAVCMTDLDLVGQSSLNSLGSMVDATSHINTGVGENSQIVLSSDVMPLCQTLFAAGAEPTDSCDQSVAVADEAEEPGFFVVVDCGRRDFQNNLINCDINNTPAPPGNLICFCDDCCSEFGDCCPDADTCVAFLQATFEACATQLGADNPQCAGFDTPCAGHPDPTLEAALTLSCQDLCQSG